MAAVHPLPPTRFRQRYVFWHVCATAALVAVPVMVYAPATSRFFVDDQLGYFLELKGERSLRDGLRLCDYSLAREFAKGDELLFRPLQMAWLAALNSLFYHNYQAWNWAQLILHVGFCLIVYRLLYALQPSIFAGMFALLFSVLYAHFEMVTWNHLGGYILGLGLFLLALLQMHRFLAAGDERSPAFLRRYVIFMSCATFFHELMVPISLLVLAYAWLKARQAGRMLPRSTVAALFLPAVVYAVPYCVHCLYAQRLLHTGGDKGLAEFFPNCLGTLKSWSLRLLLPFDYAYKHRACLRSLTEDVSPELNFIWLLVLYGGFAVCFVRGVSMGQLRRGLPLFLLMAGCLLAFTTLVNAGRTLAEIQQWCNYYRYFFCLFTLIGVYALFDFQRLSSGSMLLLPVLVGLIALNGFRSVAESRELRSYDEVRCRYFAQMDQVIEKYKTMPGFSFAIRKAPADLDPRWTIPKGYRDRIESLVRVHISEIMHYPFHDPVHPRYAISRNNNGTLLVDEVTSEWQR